MIKETEIKKAITSIIKAIGENPNREGLSGTPQRVAEMYTEIFAGINLDPKGELMVDFEEGHREMIILRDIPRSLARDIGGYFDSGGITVPVERCKNIISNSGEMLGEYDFFFEWFEKPGLEQLYNLIERLDEELAPLGCYYTITTKS